MLFFVIHGMKPNNSGMDRGGDEVTLLKHFVCVSYLMTSFVELDLFNLP